ncbi:MAG: DUF92 domain-containing protein [Gemmatimonadaceae bacterium]|jgi:uncharacterized protein (TIGR00297 family)|nr:DUF92 domain-containing protein [Gemmatimonadaceae bacterium]
MSTIPFPAALAAGPLVALAAWRAGLLDARASLAAAVIGSAAAVAGTDWVALLLTFFGTSVALGRAGRARKQARTAAVLDDERARTARQVVANGALFATGAVLGVTGLVPLPLARTGALGALAAATADTWATEIGLWLGGMPRSVVTGRPLAPGLSGGVTIAGTLGSVGGAALLGALALACGWSRPVAIAVTVGGVLGSLADSLLGASLQARRRAADGTITERARDVHGAATMHATGLRWLDNDVVNFAATGTGAVVALATFALLRP